MGSSTFFMTKKQKQKMLERRKKKRISQQQKEPDERDQKGTGEDADPVNGSGDTFPSKKRPRSSSPSSSPSPSAVADHKENSVHRSIDDGGGDDVRGAGGESETTHSLKNSNKNNLVVVVPSNLSGKEGRKFRKDARRKARADGLDADKLVFVAEGSEQEKDVTAATTSTTDDNDNQEQVPRGPAKKRRKGPSSMSFPRINEILEREKRDRELREAEEERKRVEDELPDAYKSRYVALDCEMVGTGSEGKKSVLARVSLTDWHGKILLDTYVRVPTYVTDFRTSVSGVRARHIKSPKAMDPSDCRNTVADLLRGKVLVGHSLRNDLHALMLTHPKPDIRDTAKYQPFQQLVREKWRPRKLRDLAMEHAGISIQQEGQAHDSVDDARATMELFKTVREAWEKEIQQKEAKRKKKK